MGSLERRLERLESASTQEPLIDFSDFTDDELKALLEGYDRLGIEEFAAPEDVPWHLLTEEQLRAFEHLERAIAKSGG